MKWIDELRGILRRIAGQEPPTAPPGGMPGGIPCHEAVERVFEWLDDELPQDEARHVGEHLETCARCYPLLVFERSFAEAVSRAGTVESAPDELRDRVLESLAAAGLERP